MNSLENLINYIQDTLDYRPDDEEANKWEEIKGAARNDWEALEAYKEESKHKVWREDLQD